MYFEHWWANYNHISSEKSDNSHSAKISFLQRFNNNEKWNSQPVKHLAIIGLLSNGIENRMCTSLYKGTKLKKVKITVLFGLNHLYMKYEEMEVEY